jgi:hypothetical protein
MKESASRPFWNIEDDKSHRDDVTDRENRADPARLTTSPAPQDLPDHRECVFREVLGDELAQVGTGGCLVTGGSGRPLSNPVRSVAQG